MRLDIGGFRGLILVLSAMAIIFLQNSFYIIVGLLALLVIISLTWRLHLPNVFTFILTFHWCQVVSYIFYADTAWNGDLNSVTNSSQAAYLCSLTGLIVMAYVVSRTAYKNINYSLAEFEIALSKIDPKKVLYLYLILYTVAAVLSKFAFAFGSLTQVFLNIALLKWAGFVLLGYLSYKNKKYRIYFALAFVLDFVGGFFSFFSSFKDVFFYTAVVVMTFISKISFSVSLRGILIMLSVFYMAVTWTVIKGDYRQFVNQGSKLQVVAVSKEEAYHKLSELLSEVNHDKINEGTGQFFYRLQYVYHLSKAMDMVPAEVPFQHGALWKETVVFVAVPRFLAPDKATLDASVKASKFTGIDYLGAESGVSFSLGYFADCYVDFGIPGMFIALASIAFIWSLIFRFLLTTSTNNIVINYAIVTGFFIQFSFFEMDGTFMFGRLFTTFVVFLFLKYTIFKKMEKYITYEVLNSA